MPGVSGDVSYRPGTTQAAADSLEVRLFGRGAHGSMPESSIDPVVMAASTVLRLQTIVSREVAASQAAVVTIGALQAGTKDNVIPDDALLKLNVRTFDEAVRTRVLSAIERIINAEAEASGAPTPPQITYTEHYPLTVNDPDQTRHVADALRSYFGTDRVHELAAPVSASEDFGSFGSEWRVPSVFWYVGGTDPAPTGRPKRPAGSPMTSPQTTTQSSPQSFTRHLRPACRPSPQPRSAIWDGTAEHQERCVNFVEVLRPDVLHARPSREQPVSAILGARGRSVFREPVTTSPGPPSETAHAFG